MARGPSPSASHGRRAPNTSAPPYTGSAARSAITTPICSTAGGRILNSAWATRRFARSCRSSAITRPRALRSASKARSSTCASASDQQTAALELLDLQVVAHFLDAAHALSHLGGSRLFGRGVDEAAQLHNAFAGDDRDVAGLGRRLGNERRFHLGRDDTVVDHLARASVGMTDRKIIAYVLHAAHGVRHACGRRFFSGGIDEAVQLH